MPIKISYETVRPTDERWEYWLKQDSCALYKTPLSESDLNDINHFMKEMSISISSDPDDHDRTEMITDLFAEQHLEIYDELSNFTHFYFLFEYSPKKPLLISELGEIMRRFLEFAKTDDSEPKYYFFAAESRNDIPNSLSIEIRTGKMQSS